MPSKAEKIKVGELRPSQLLLTFGVGAVVDLPHFSVMVMGLNYWDKAKASVVSEPRLLATVRDELGYSVTELR
ncbi:MAG: hypothetical protein JNN15_15825, partial [Blastocatellia bacterium]|nr:hypothetical protein [Blastocatellia bacterium]